MLNNIGHENKIYAFPYFFLIKQLMMNFHPKEGQNKPS